MQLAEAGEIDIVEECEGGLVHLIQIERIGDFFRKFVKEWVFASRDIILVGTRNGIKTGMGIRRNLFDAVDGDVVWQ